LLECGPDGSSRSYYEQVAKVAAAHLAKGLQADAATQENASLGQAVQGYGSLE
jgi:hypothetical protein